MDTVLSERRVKELLEHLNEEQLDFLNQYITLTKMSKWRQILAEKKGIMITPDMTSEEIEQHVDWVLVEILDGGHSNKPYRCECGTPLRFQYIVYNKKRGKTYGLGETCFENYTQLSPEILRDIKQGFHIIDLERNEILIKFEMGLIPEFDEYKNIKGVPELLLEQIQLGLPLTEKQAYNIRGLIKTNKRDKKHKEIYQSFSKEQLTYFNNLSIKQKEEIYDT